MPTPKVNPGQPHDVILRPGDVVAVGLRHKQCPVGLVTAVNGQGFRLDLYSWAVGMFSAGTAVVVWPQVLAVGPLARQRGDGVFEMDPLAEFQAAWTKAASAGPAAAEEFDHA